MTQSEPSTHEPKKEMRRLGSKLNTLRKKQGWTLQKAAEELGYNSNGYIYAIENSKKIPSAEFLIRVSRVFSVSLDVLMKDELELE